MERPAEAQRHIARIDMADYIDSADVVIIGGGVSGLSSGFRLAKAGKEVILVEKGIVGWEASGRNGGGVGDRGAEPPVVALAAESLRLWDNLDEELGYPTEFKRIELLAVALTESAMGEVYETVEIRKKQGLEYRVLGGEEIRKMVPEISERVVGGSQVTSYGHANPQRASQAFAWGFQDAGGRLYQHTAATGINVEHGRSQERRDDGRNDQSRRGGKRSRASNRPHRRDGRTAGPGLTGEGGDTGHDSAGASAEVPAPR